MSYFHITARPTARRGFTLIELLVVIVIIGILASLLFVGGNEVRKNVRRGIIKLKISQVETALESYNKKYGEYPPDFSDEAAVMRHVRKRWPNWQNGPKDFGEFCSMVQSAAGYNFTPETGHRTKSRGAHIGALAFWLGGIRDSNGMLNGFSADVANPLGSGPGITQWDKDSQFMELTEGSNCEIVDGLPVITANGFPIAYFKPNSAGQYVQKNDPDDPLLCFHLPFTKPEWSDMGVAAPYAKSGTTIDNAVWYNPKKYQLIHPGLDGKFCESGLDEFRVIDPDKDVMLNITLADRDNQANFGGTTIESAGK